MSDADWLAAPIRNTGVFETAAKMRRAPRSAPWTEVGPLDTGRWLELRFGLEVPTSAEELPDNRWDARLRGDDLAPAGTLLEVIGQAWDLWYMARRIRAIAAAGQSVASGDTLATAAEEAGVGGPLGVLEGAARELLRAPGLLEPIGMARLFEAVFWSAQRLRGSVAFWGAAGLVGSPGTGHPTDTPKRAFVAWLRRGGARDIEIAALLAHLCIEKPGRSPGLTRNQALADFSSRRVKNCQGLERVDPELDPLHVLAFLAASRAESNRLGVDLAALTGVLNVHPLSDAASEPPPIKGPRAGSPWYWVPVPAWAIPSDAALADQLGRMPGQLVQLMTELLRGHLQARGVPPDQPEDSRNTREDPEDPDE